MNRPLPETLDETIDRVAAAITAVPADPGFSARLAPRLDAPGRDVSTWMLAAAAAAAIVLAVLVAAPERSTPKPAEQANARPQAAPAVDAATAVSPSEAITAGAVAPAFANAAPALTHAAREPLHALVERTSAVAALDHVETLDVDDLLLHQLHVAPVDVAHLDIETLDVPEIGTTDDPKE